MPGITAIWFAETLQKIGKYIGRICMVCVRACARACVCVCVKGKPGNDVQVAGEKGASASVTKQLKATSRAKSWINP